jgi:cellulose synthase/poly-beta-1,6-N-acetylglucosamine synthase-like glycosyltransferase
MVGRGTGTGPAGTQATAELRRPSGKGDRRCPGGGARGGQGAPRAAQLREGMVQGSGFRVWAASLCLPWLGRRWCAVPALSLMAARARALTGCRPLAQVCDDSTRESVRKKVDAAVISCLEQGHNVQLVRRDNRSGYKAGAMVDGMARVEDQEFEYVAIFDADFEPPEDFLYQTIVHMVRTQAAAARACRLGLGGARAAV